MNTNDQESTKDIISNLLSSSHGAHGSEAFIMHHKKAMA